MNQFQAPTKALNYRIQGKYLRSLLLLLILVLLCFHARSLSIANAKAFIHLIIISRVHFHFWLQSMEKNISSLSFHSPYYLTIWMLLEIVRTMSPNVFPQGNMPIYALVCLVTTQNIRVQRTQARRKRQSVQQHMQQGLHLLEELADTRYQVKRQERNERNLLDPVLRLLSCLRNSGNSWQKGQKTSFIL